MLYISSFKQTYCLLDWHIEFLFILFCRDSVVELSSELEIDGDLDVELLSFLISDMDSEMSSYREDTSVDWQKSCYIWVPLVAVDAERFYEMVDAL